jgi:hypothetical protein
VPCTLQTRQPLKASCAAPAWSLPPVWSCPSCASLLNLCRTQHLHASLSSYTLHAANALHQLSCCFGLSICATTASSAAIRPSRSCRRSWPCIQQQDAINDGAQCTVLVLIVLSAEYLMHAAGSRGYGGHWTVQAGQVEVQTSRHEACNTPVEVQLLFNSFEVHTCAARNSLPLKMSCRNWKSANPLATPNPTRNEVRRMRSISVVGCDQVRRQ